MQSPPKEQFVALAGLRGIAALVVLQWHGNIFLGGAPLPGGYLAVDFFFLLSGWVLAHAYDQRLATGLSAGAFLRQRLIRLYPVLILALLLTFAGGALVGHPPVTGLLLGLLFLPDFWAQPVDWLVRPAWSLIAELAANLPFGLWHRRLSTGVLATTVLVALAALIFLAIAHGSLDVGHSLTSWPGLFARVFFSFPLGVLLYRHRDRLAAWAPSWAAWPSGLLLVLVLGLPAPAGLKGLLDLFTVAALLPAVLLLASAARPHRLTARIAEGLGAMSYPLYLLHVAIFSAVNMLLLLFTKSGLDEQPLAVTLPLVGAIVALSLLVDRVYDRPLRRWLAAPRPAVAALEPKPAGR